MRSTQNLLDLLTFMEELNYKKAITTLYLTILTFFLQLWEKKNHNDPFYFVFFIPWQGEHNPYLRYKHRIQRNNIELWDINKKLPDVNLELWEKKWVYIS